MSENGGALHDDGHIDDGIPHHLLNGLSLCELRESEDSDEWEENEDDEEIGPEDLERIAMLQERLDSGQWLLLHD